MPTKNFTPFTYQNLSFTNIAISETDIGNITNLTSTSTQPIGVSTGLGQNGIGWTGFSAGAGYGNASTTINFNYTVTDTSSTTLIDSASQLYTPDLYGPGVTLTAIETITSTTGAVLGTETIADTVGSNGVLTQKTYNDGVLVTNGTPLLLSQAEQAINVNVSLTMASNTATPIVASEFEQSYGTIQTTGGGGNPGTPAVSIVKQVTSVGGVAGDPAVIKAGEIIDYSVVVTNTGTEALTNVAVKDTTLGTTLGTIATLAVGASATYTTSMVATQAEIDAGTAIANTAAVTDNQNVGGTSTATTNVTQSPAVSILKTVTSVGGVAGDPAIVKAGEVIDYSVVVTNTGNETLTSVVVKDPTLGTTLGTLATLAVGASATYTTSMVATQGQIDAGAPVANTATVTDHQNVGGTSTATTGVTQTPAVSILKTVTSVGGVAGDPSITQAGEVIDYSVVVTNTGNETLTNVAVKDPTLGTTLGTLASLAVGASATYTTSMVATQGQIDVGAPVANTATVTDNQNVGGTSTATTNVTQSPAVSILKTVTSVGGVAGDPAITQAGEVIDYSVVVTNTGNETLTNVAVKDPTLGTTLGTLASLAVGASATYTTSMVATQAEITAGVPVTNTATVTDTQNVTGTSTASTGVAQTSSGISIIKQPCSVVVNQCGQVTYTFSVTNTGSTALTNVNVTDNIGTAANPDNVTPTLITQGTNGVLGAGQTWLYSATISSAGNNNAGSGDSNNSGSNDGNSKDRSGNSDSHDSSDGNSKSDRHGDKGSSDHKDGSSNSDSQGSSDGNSKDGSSKSDGHGDKRNSDHEDGFSKSDSHGSSNDGSGNSNSCDGNSNSKDGSSKSDRHGDKGNSDHKDGSSNSDSQGSSDGNSKDGSSKSDRHGDKGYSDHKDGSGRSDRHGDKGNSDHKDGSDKPNGGGSDDNSCCHTPAPTTNLNGQADTVTVTATIGGTPSQGSVTATDTKEVLVLGANSDVTIGGTAPTGSLSALYGSAQTLEFAYNPGNTVSLQQVQSGLGSVSGTNSDSLAFMTITNKSGSNIYFEGAVTSGEKIFADATTNVLTNTQIAGGQFDTTAGADIFATVYASQQAFKSGAAGIQEMAYNTSGSQAMHFGDVIGSLSVVGYVGATGGHLVA